MIAMPDGIEPSGESRLLERIELEIAFDRERSNTKFDRKIYGDAGLSFAWGLIFVRSRLPASSLVPTIRHEVASLDADLPLSDIKTMDERYREATWRTWTIGVLLSIFAGLALVLALVGVFAVLAQSVAQRTREIGVRMALSAAPRDIQRLVMGRALAIAAAGVAIGVGAAWFTSRLLTTFLYDVEPTDPGVVSAIALLLFVVTLVASFIPARRAAHVDPLETIRSE